MLQAEADGMLCTGRQLIQEEKMCVVKFSKQAFQMHVVVASQDIKSSMCRAFYGQNSTESMNISISMHIHMHLKFYHEYDMMRNYTRRHYTIQHNTTRHNPAQPNLT